MAESPTTKQVIGTPGTSAFPPYPAAVKAHGLVFLSGHRNMTTAADGPDAYPPADTLGLQGHSFADAFEQRVAFDAWGAHASLDATLKAAGSAPEHMMRLRIWQQDKRLYPAYERVRMIRQPRPSPSSGHGVKSVTGPGFKAIGLDGIAIAPGAGGLFSVKQTLRPGEAVSSPLTYFELGARSGPLVCLAGHVPVRAVPGHPIISGYEDVPPEGRLLATGRSHADSRDGPTAARAWYIYDMIRRNLALGEADLAHVVHMTVYVDDLRDVAMVHRVHRQMFEGRGPALTVAGFAEVGHRGANIAVEPTAMRGGKDWPVLRIDWPYPAPLAAPAALASGPFVWFSGMLGIGENGALVTSDHAPQGPEGTLVRALASGEHSPGFAAQTWAAFAQLARTAAEAAMNLTDLVKLTLLVRDEQDLPVFEAIRQAFIPSGLPAFECLCVPWPGALLEAVVQIEAIGLNTRWNQQAPLPG